jgi:hypothetical protein
MTRRSVSIAVLILLVAGSSFAAGGYQPPESSGGCDECAFDPYDGSVRCNAVDDPEFGDPGWSGCVGGYMCLPMPGGGIYCEPNCGKRCNWA